MSSIHTPGDAPNPSSVKRKAIPAWPGIGWRQIPPGANAVDAGRAPSSLVAMRETVSTLPPGERPPNVHGQPRQAAARGIAPACGGRLRKPGFAPASDGCTARERRNSGGSYPSKRKLCGARRPDFPRGDARDAVAEMLEAQRAYPPPHRGEGALSFMQLA